MGIVICKEIDIPAFIKKKKIMIFIHKSNDLEDANDIDVQLQSLNKSNPFLQF